MNKEAVIGISILAGAMIGGLFVGLFSLSTTSKLEMQVRHRDEKIARFESHIMCNKQKDMSYELCKALLDK